VADQIDIDKLERTVAAMNPGPFVRSAERQRLMESEGYNALRNAAPALIARVRDDAATIATLTAERDAAVRERDEARRSGLTLTAEERAALEYAGKRCRVGFDRDYPEVVAYVATIDRLLAGARTVMAAAPLHPMAEDGSGPTTGAIAADAAARGGA
jgi:hypothetical protein